MGAASALLWGHGEAQAPRGRIRYAAPSGAHFQADKYAAPRVILASAANTRFRAAVNTGSRNKE